MDGQQDLLLFLDLATQLRMISLGWAKYYIPGEPDVEVFILGYELFLLCLPEYLFFLIFFGINKLPPAEKQEFMISNIG